MAAFPELELKTFDLSNDHSDLSLSVTSIALVSNLPSSHYSSEELIRLIQLKQLWLVSSGVCRIQIIVDRNQFPAWMEDPEVGFLEYLASTICQCPLWSTLGLTIKQEDIQYQPLYDGAPNLYFIVEQPHKSTALLTPPHIPTARFNGIECLFHYQSSIFRASHVNAKESYVVDEHIRPHQTTWASNYQGSSAVNTPTEQTRQDWGDVAHLTQMALHIIIGIKKRIHGLRLCQLGTGPSLLELAPTIWNAHYLKAMAVHVTNFPIISTILTASTRGQSASLRRKSAKLLVPNALESNSATNIETVPDSTIYQSSIQQRLWDLLRTGLKPTIHTSKPSTDGISQPSLRGDDALAFASPEINRLDESDILGNISRGNADLDCVSELCCLLPQLPGYQVRHDWDSPEIAEGNWLSWYENECMVPVDEEDPLEALSIMDEPPGPTGGFGAYHSFLDLPVSSPGELREPSIVQQSHPDSIDDFIVDADDIYISDYVHGAGAAYDTVGEMPFLSEAGLLGDMQPCEYGNEDDYILGSSTMKLAMDYYPGEEQMDPRKYFNDTDCDININT
ncbi:hypothetical protein AAE478_005585 [Parahypoxylon ruwenzoriense]